uniref:Heparanase n=1 Tax=Anopheles minimus TaxID=112268 RepID=A0A182VS35_9DIPT
MTLVLTKVQLFTRLWLAVVILLLVPGVRGQAADNEVPFGSETVRQLGVSVNTKRLANVLVDEFVSFYAKPQDIFDGQGNPISETSFLMAQSLGGTYLKVLADSSQLHLQTIAGESVIGQPDDLELVQISANAWQAFYEWARRANLVPVFVLDYPNDDDHQWDAKSALRVLTVANTLGIAECRWQLGNGHVKDASKYADDLRTFRTMLQAFPKQQWTVVGSELKPQFNPLEEIQYFHANADSLVEAITMTRPQYDSAAWNYTSLQREIHLRGLSKQRLPIWLDLVGEQQPNPMARTNMHQTVGSCGKSCVQDGLEYARTLGEAARGGISAVFQPLRRNDIQQYTFNYLIALLYKQTVGHKVFPVQFPMDSSDMDTIRMSVYSYCTRNRTGSLTLVLVNGEQDGATNVTIKLMTRSLSSPVELYLLTVQDGQPTVNNQPLEAGTPLPHPDPVKAVTTLTHGVSFYVPSEAILFAVVPGVQIRECRNDVLPQRKKLPRELQPDRTSADMLLEHLIGELVEKTPQTNLQRERRSIMMNDRPARANFAGEKRKRFHGRLFNAPQTDSLTESLSEVLADAAPALEPTERTARGPRQTQAYKRQQRRIRQKEKRLEKRNLNKMKHPLREARRERSKRGDMVLGRRSTLNQPNRRFQDRLMKRMSAKLASRKTKRSSLAEAVNEPPNFAVSEEEVDELHQRSDFPLGDVHLVISKGESDGEDGYVSTDEDADQREDRMPSWGAPRHRPAVRRRVSINQRDFHRFAPVRSERRPIVERNNEEDDCVRRRSLRRGPKEEEVRETRRIDRFLPIRREHSEEMQRFDERPTLPRTDSREAFTIAQTKSKRFESQMNEQRDLETTEDNSPEDTVAAVSDETPEETSDRAMGSEEEEEIHLFTPAPRTSEERLMIPNFEPTWSLESTSAEVAELQPNRYKRSFPTLSSPADAEGSASIESDEVQRLEDFFRTNAKLQQKFAEMFDLLLEAIEELESEDNDAREVTDEEEVRLEKRLNEANEPSHKRTKRNVLLHPQSWESRERSNMIHRLQQSDESSYENFIIPPQQQKGIVASAISGQSAQREARDPQPDNGNDEEGKPGAFMLRSVVNFMRRASSEFHQLFSSWFPKNA